MSLRWLVWVMVLGSMHWGWITTPAAGQVTRLPVVDLSGAASGVEPAGYAGQPSEVLQSPGEAVSPAPPQLPPGARNGFFQKLIFDATWLPRTGARGMGGEDLELKGVFALPCPTVQSPLLIIPGFAVRYLDGPAEVEMPPRLYDAYCTFRWLSQVAPRLGLDLSFTPGVFSDFEQGSDEAFRPTGYGAAAWTWTPTTKLVLGVGYFNRLAVDFLPIGGIIWTPNEETNFELLFPRPKLARRLALGGAVPGGGSGNVAWWGYLAAEFGGGAWAFARSDGQPDLVDFSDYRLYLGMERKVPGGLDARFEIGYVFSRKILYQSRSADFHPNDTLMLRGGVSY